MSSVVSFHRWRSGQFGSHAEFDTKVSDAQIRIPVTRIAIPHPLRALVLGITAALAGTASPLCAQDTTYRGIFLNGSYDPLRDKVAIVVLPIIGAFGDSIRTMVQRDLDYSDRFTVIPVDPTDPSAFRMPGSAASLNYSLFTHLNAAAVVEITQIGGGLQVALHDVAHSQVVNVAERALSGNPLSRDWRLGVHETSDEIERWIYGQRGIAATRIAYLQGTSIRIIDTDGADEITVPTDEFGFSPAWSPNGSTLVYSTYGPASRLVLFDLATGRSRTFMTAPVNTQYITPRFAPDGNSIVFARPGDNGSDIYSVPVSGSDLTPRRLTVGRGADNVMPTVSPNGRRIVYMTSALGHPELYIMDADGTGADLLTTNDFSEKNYRSDPDWSSDGRLIAYQERINDRFQIRIIPVTGGTPKLLTSEGENEQPSWAPDARHLVFTSTRTGARQLWVLDTESNRVRQLTTSAGSRLAAWSPRLNAPAQQ